MRAFASLATILASTKIFNEQYSETEKALHNTVQGLYYTYISRCLHDFSVSTILTTNTAADYHLAFGAHFHIFTSATKHKTQAYDTQ